MPVYPPTPQVANRSTAIMQPFGPAGVPTPQPPNPPSDLSLAQTPGSGLIATWSAPAIDRTHSAATAFNLRYSPSGAGAWTIVSNVSSPHVLAGLSAGTAFDVQLQGLNAAGTGAWSASSSLSTDLAAPNTPAAVSLAQGTGSDLTVTWTAPATDSTHSTAAAFNLRWRPAGAGTWTVVTGVSSPYDLSGFTSAVAIDVELQAVNSGGESGWSAASTLTTGMVGPYPPGAPVLTTVAPPPDGNNSELTISWTPPEVDGTHGAATGYNLRYSPSGAGTWTTVSGVASPHALSGRAGASAIDVQIQATNAAANPGPWSATLTGMTWGATVAPGSWVAATSQVHNTGVAPNGGVNCTATPAPTAVTGAAFAWSTSASTPPSSGLIAAAANGQTNGWGQWFNTPASAGTYYLWLLAQGAGGATIGALVSNAIVVS